MTILGSPEEQAIPVGYITFELPKKAEEVPPVAAEAVDWTKYIPWILLGIALLAK